MIPPLPMHQLRRIGLGSRWQERVLPRKLLVSHQRGRVRLRCLTPNHMILISVVLHFGLQVNHRFLLLEQGLRRLGLVLVL